VALPLSYNVRNLRVRWQVTLLAVLGIALVVAVFVVLLSMSSGFAHALRTTGRLDNAIVVQEGSQSELTSGISRDQANAIMVDFRVARGGDGRPLASPEVVVVASLPRKLDGLSTNVTVRGVTTRAFEVRGGIRMTRGRRFTPGLEEIVVGKRLGERFGLEEGATVRLQRRDWQVVGVFASEGSGFESELWGDLDVIAPAFFRTGGYQSMVVRLTDASELEAFARSVEDDPRFQLEVSREQEYYEAQAGPVAGALLALSVFVSVIMGIGAVFGAMNTMYAIVAARTREIGTLRALGFSRSAILLSFVLESVFLAVVGGVLGCGLAWPAHGIGAATGGANFSEVAFAFRLTPEILLSGLVFAAMMGFVGGLLPALRGARLPIASALREA